MLSREEVEKRYPGAVEAVLWHERPEVKESIWDEIERQGNLLGPEVVRAILKQVGGQAVEAVPEGPMKGFLDQFDCPDFMSYIKDKLAGLARRIK
jgi:hypothetical protein